MDALSDPTRLRLLRLLERHELGVVELCDVLQLPQSTVSRHLKVLADQRWVRSRRQGTTHLYRMILDELALAPRRLWLLAREQTEGWATIEQDHLRLARLLRTRQSQAQAFFAGAAGEWDRLRRELYGESFALDAMLALLPRELVVADLGCGTGQTAVALARHVARVIGIDNAPAMLKAAQRRAGDLGNVEIRRGELEAVPLEDGACDAALMLLVLSYVSEPPVVLKELRRILKPGGRAVIVDLLPHDREDFRRQLGQQRNGFESAELALMLKSAGLDAAQVSALPPEPGARGPALFIATATAR
jgi:ArsR family transcriptional regulator